MSMEGKIGDDQFLNKLTGKITEIPVVDDTLTKEGKSADAKKTGEELKRLEAKIDSVIAALGNGE